MTDRYASERLLPEEFIALMEDASQDMLNCSVLDRTRVNPTDPDDERGKYQWMRIVHTVCPELSPNGGEWVELKSRRSFTAKEGLARVAMTPPILPDGLLDDLRTAERTKLEKKAKEMGIKLS